MSKLKDLYYYYGLSIIGGLFGGSIGGGDLWILFRR